MSRMIVLVSHLIKWDVQPERRSGSRKATVSEQRDRVELVLEDSPSLERHLRDRLPLIFAKATRRAAEQIDVELRLHTEVPYRLAEILDDSFFPEGRIGVR